MRMYFSDQTNAELRRSTYLVISPWLCLRFKFKIFYCTFLTSFCNCLCDIFNYGQLLAALSIHIITAQMCVYCCTNSLRSYEELHFLYIIELHPEKVLFSILIVTASMLHKSPLSCHVTFKSPLIRTSWYVTKLSTTYSIVFGTTPELIST